MNNDLTKEFQAEYENTQAPNLPVRLSGYHFLACLREDSEREIWLLENASGRRVICKHSSGEYANMLRAENDMEHCRASGGKFSFFPCIFDYYETETDSYLIREYIEGDTLEELIEKNGPMAPEQARSVILQLCQCFLRLHHAEPPIIYRDLKPSNVVMTKAGECFLIDMGSARVFRNGNERDTVLVGTAATAAPEQYGARQTDARTDIYAIGILYAYLLTGELDNIREQALLPKGPEAAIIRKAISFDPDNRYQSVEELLLAINPPAALPNKKGYIATIAALTTALACCLFVLLKPSVPTGDNIAANKPAIDTTTDTPVVDTTADTPAIDAPTPKTPVPAPEHQAAEEVTFESELLHQAVALALGKTNDESILYGELNQITGLYVCGASVFDQWSRHSYSPLVHTVDASFYSYTNPPRGDICDLSLLQYMPLLNELILDYQQISDLSPLDGLPLSQVSLCGNPVSDLSPLANRTYLFEIVIDDTSVDSLLPLGTLTHLQTLSITRSKVTTIAPVCDCPITYLAIGELALEDFDRLPQMSLYGLSCKKLPPSAYEPISRIRSLSFLSIEDSDISSLRELPVMDQISTLGVARNQLTDLEGIDHFPNLIQLYAGDNRLKSCAGLESAQKLQELYIEYNNVRDFTALNGFSSLQKILIKEELLYNLYQEIPNPWFEVLTQ